MPPVGAWKFHFEITVVNHKKIGHPNNNGYDKKLVIAKTIENSGVVMNLLKYSWTVHYRYATNAIPRAHTKRHVKVSSKNSPE